MAEVFSNEKEIDKEIVFQAVESALEAAACKRYEHPVEVRVSIDRKTGDVVTYRRWEVVAEALQEPAQAYTQMELAAAQAREPELQVGDYYEEEIESVGFGRISAQTAKQVIIHKIREAERKKIVEAYQDKVGELITGVVKRVEKGSVVLDLGGHVEALIPREEMVPRETVRNGDRVRGYLKAVRSEPRGPQLFVSRTAPELLLALFRLEVPEVAEGLIDLKGAARDPGVRAKLAVKANDPRLDAVGACVGMRGSRVQAVSNELAGERVDIVLWNPSEAQFVINAMSPAEIESIVIDEDRHSMDISVSSENLSQAIGRGGQNVRLASELTGWELNVMDASKAMAESGAEVEKIRQQFMDLLDIDQEIAQVLVDVGFTSVEEIAYVPVNEMLETGEFDVDTINELKARAKDALLISAIASEEKVESVSASEEFLALEGMSAELAVKLVEQGLVNVEDVAELAVPDLVDMVGMDEASAGRLIMAARKPWFESQDSE
ncbi:MAG: transcription termination factor NusA [Methylococcales bacterium]|nr:transcription termination factor NusA [Methylococcales bacterium]